MVRRLVRYTYVLCVCLMKYQPGLLGLDMKDLEGDWMNHLKNVFQKLANLASLQLQQSAQFLFLLHFSFAVPSRYATNWKGKNTKTQRSSENDLEFYKNYTCEHKFHLNLMSFFHKLATFVSTTQPFCRRRIFLPIIFPPFLSFFFGGVTLSRLFESTKQTFPHCWFIFRVRSGPAFGKCLLLLL